MGTDVEVFVSEFWPTSGNFVGQGSVGTVLVWGLVNTGQTPNWENINTIQTPVWTSLDDGQNPNWTQIPTS